MTHSPEARPGRPLLSVCMIVRDEAENIAGIISSVQPVADEVVVVDTGSHDQTAAIAETLGARVLHFAWTDDFSEARNRALAAARGQWILTMDADQRLNASTIPALKAALARTDCLAQTATIALHAQAAATDAAAAPAGGTAPLRQFQSLRLVRNDARIRYRGRVHEDVAASLIEAGSASWPDSGVVLDDFGYLDADARARKRARNLALLRRACADEPDAVYPAYKLALTVLSEDVTEGQRLLDEALDRLRRLPPAQWRTLPFLPGLVAQTVAGLGDRGRLVEAAQLCLEFQPALGPALGFTTGTALARAGFWDEARKYLGAFLENRSHALSRLFEAEPDAHPARACRHLAWIEHMNGHLDEAADWIERGNSMAGPQEHMELAMEAIEIQLLCGALPAAGAALDSLAATARQEPSIFPRLMYLSAKVAHGAGDLKTALELASAGQARGDDSCAALLAGLEIEAGEADAGRLAQHYDAISGRQLDTLAVKLLIGRHLGIDWPHAVPAQCAEG